MSNLKEIRSGAFWVMLFVGLGGVLSLFRNWLISSYDQTGQMIGEFALVMIFFNIIATFFTFGGSTILTNYIPKIKEEQESLFFNSYLAINFCLFLVLLFVYYFFPNFLQYLSNDRISLIHTSYIFLLAIPVTCFSSFNYFFQGKRNYRFSSFLNQLPNLIFLASVLAIYFLNYYYGFKLQEGYYLYFFSILLLLASITGIIISLKKFKRNNWKFAFFIPNNFWKYSINIHLISIITFAFIYIDQFFVLNILGIKELGFYFILIQIIELIRFIPNKIGQVLLASFSKIIKDGSLELKQTYDKLSYSIIVLNVAVASSILVFSKEILIFFNIPLENYFSAIIILTIGASIASLGNINSMLILAKEKSRIFLINSIIMISVQFLVIYLLKDYLLIGIVIGRFSSIILAQLGLFLIIRFNIDKSLSVNANYLKSQVFILTLSGLVYFLNVQNVYINILFLLIVFLLILLFFNLNFKRMKSFIK